ERKMELTEQNLLRVNDITKELERQLDGLNRQAKKAEKYKQLKAEIREIELHQASHRFLELLAQGKVLQAKLETLSADEKASVDQRRELETATDARRTTLDDDAEQIESLPRALHALESQDKRDEQTLSHWEGDARQTEPRAGDARDEVAALFARQ